MGLHAAILLCALTAASPTPRVAQGASAYLFIPKLDKLDGIAQFSQVAGKKTPMLRSAVWSEEFFPVISLDVTSGPALEAAGIDPTGTLTTSFLPAGRIACVDLKQPKEFTMTAQSALDYQGRHWKGELHDVDAFGGATDDAGNVVTGFVQKGKVACVISAAHGRGASLLDDAIKMLGAPKVPGNWKTSSALPGVLYAIAEQGAIALRGSSSQLIGEARAQSQSVNAPSLAGAGMSPYGDIPNGGVLTARAHVEPASIAPYARGFVGQLSEFCAGCDSKAINEAAKAIAEELTGQVFLRVDSINMAGGLRSQAARYFAVRHAYVAEVKDAAKVKEALKKVETAKGIRKTETGVALVAQEGDIDVSLVGKNLIVSNNPDAKQTVLKLLSAAKGQKLQHGAEFQGDPKLVARALKQVSLLDALANQELAGLLAASTEAGPLLASSEKVTGYADTTAGGQRAQFTWTLEAPPAADAGH